VAVDPIQPVEPRLELIGRCRADLGEPLELGHTPWGRRRIIPILGGEFDGPGLSATILAGGADWQAPNACASFPASGSDYQVCGKLLPDTGITYMMLTPTKQPPAPAKLQQTLTTPAKPASAVSGQTSDTSATTSQVVPEGTPMTLAIGATGHPVFSYGFKVGGATPATPDGVQWRAALDVPPAHINSGRHVLAATDYAYDAACGHAGFRPAPATP
jgi:hypothetical protein